MAFPSYFYTPYLCTILTCKVLAIKELFLLCCLDAEPGRYLSTGSKHVSQMANMRSLDPKVRVTATVVTVEVQMEIMIITETTTSAAQVTVANPNHNNKDHHQHNRRCTNLELPRTRHEPDPEPLLRGRDQPMIVHDSLQRDTSRHERTGQRQQPQPLRRGKRGRDLFLTCRAAHLSGDQAMVRALVRLLDLSARTRQLDPMRGGRDACGWAALAAGPVETWTTVTDAFVAFSS